MNTTEVVEGIEERLAAREDPFGVPVANMFIELEIKVLAQKAEIAVLRQEIKLARLDRMNIIERLDELVAKFNGKLVKLWN